jgi:hypothetical protein
VGKAIEPTDATTGIVADLRAIAKRGRPDGPARAASARASYLVRFGLARRTGVVLRGTSVLAEYALTLEGDEWLADNPELAAEHGELRS